jgi:hypothetical protein
MKEIFEKDAVQTNLKGVLRKYSVSQQLWQPPLVEDQLRHSGSAKSAFSVFNKS